MTGAVTLPAGLCGRDIYLQDATSGIKVYLRSGDHPALAAGDQVRATGWTRRYHGEVELSVPRPSYLTRLGPGEPPEPVYVRTGLVDEAHEGELILIAGVVVKFEPQALTLDDCSGPARIFFPAELPWRLAVCECRQVLGCAGGRRTVCVRGAVAGRVPGDPAVQDGRERRAVGAAGDGK